MIISHPGNNFAVLSVYSLVKWSAPSNVNLTRTDHASKVLILDLECSWSTLITFGEIFIAVYRAVCLNNVEYLQHMSIAGNRAMPPKITVIGNRKHVKIDSHMSSTSFVKQNPHFTLFLLLTFTHKNEGDILIWRRSCARSSTRGHFFWNRGADFRISESPLLELNWGIMESSLTKLDSHSTQYSEVTQVLKSQFCTFQKCVASTHKIQLSSFWFYKRWLTLNFNEKNKIEGSSYHQTWKSV